MFANLNPEKAFIFRIVHVHNLPWILDRNGLDCRSAPNSNPNYVNIGNPDLIDKRARHSVPIPPGGNLSDYVPFYFTPCSMMMYNIYTGHGGVKKRKNDEIVIFVSSLRRLNELGLRFVFTSQHAYAAGTEYYSSLSDLDQIDWPLLRSRNFKTNDDDPGKGLRYQAEALVHGHLPLLALLGIGCHSKPIKTRLEGMLADRGEKISVKVTPNWYF